MDDADSAKWNAVYKAVEVALDVIETTSPGVLEDHPNRIVDLIARMIDARPSRHHTPSAHTLSE